MGQRNQSAGIIVFTLIAGGVVIAVGGAFLLWMVLGRAVDSEPHQIEASIRQAPEEVFEDASESTTDEE